MNGPIYSRSGPHYQGRECAKHAAAQARFAELVEERRNLFVSRTFMPPSAATAAAKCADRGDRSRNRTPLCAEPAGAAVGKVGLILRGGRFRWRVLSG
jgi:hypothetical protein